MMTERYQSELQGPYFKDNFIFDSETDSYICPQGQRLPFRGLRRSKLPGSGSFRLYRASRTACRSCPAFGICTKDKHTGRALWISSSEELLHQHRQWMNTDAARTLYARRKEMSEPTFGILKDQMLARRFLLRGLANVRAEFNLLATAFNLRTLWRVWAKLGRRSTRSRMEIADSLATNVQIQRHFVLNPVMPSARSFAY